MKFISSPSTSMRKKVSQSLSWPSRFPKGWTTYSKIRRTSPQLDPLKSTFKRRLPRSWRRKRSRDRTQICRRAVPPWLSRRRRREVQLTRNRLRLWIRSHQPRRSTTIMSMASRRRRRTLLRVLPMRSATLCPPLRIRKMSPRPRQAVRVLPRTWKRRKQLYKTKPLTNHFRWWSSIR